MRLRRFLSSSKQTTQPSERRSFIGAARKDNHMGAWSCESFGNDDACDWSFELRGVDDLSLIEATLDAVLASGDEYLEAPEASQAIAAAEAIARLQGNFGVCDSYSQPVDEWVASVKLDPPRELARKALRVLDRILQEPSELLELWEESGEGTAWTKAMTDLRARIHVG
jgi:hypothetical protein